MARKKGVSPSRVLAVSVPGGEVVGDYPIPGDEVLRNPELYSLLNLDRMLEDAQGQRSYPEFTLWKGWIQHFWR